MSAFSMCIADLFLLLLSLPRTFHSVATPFKADDEIMTLEKGPIFGIFFKVLGSE